MAWNEYVPPPKRYAAPGEVTYREADYADRYETAQRITEDAVLLSSTYCDVACRACVTDIDSLRIAAAVIAVGPVHTHLLARFGALRIRPTIGRLKSVMTRAIKQHDAGFQPKRTWSKGCHPRSCADERDYWTKLRYVQRHENDGAVVRISEHHRDARTSSPSRRLRRRRTIHRRCFLLKDLDMPKLNQNQALS
jgi:hypothetical protein